MAPDAAWPSSQAPALPTQACTAGLEAYSLLLVLQSQFPTLHQMQSDTGVPLTIRMSPKGRPIDDWELSKLTIDNRGMTSQP